MTETSTTRTTRTADWSDPGLVAGRSRVALPVMIALILIGSAVDTFAFKVTLDVFLRAQQWISWGMAIGITVVAQLAAWTMGWLGAYRRHDDPSVPRSALAVVAALWFGLGACLWYVRWCSAGGSAAGASTSFGATDGNSAALVKAHAGAFLFLTLFLLSGLVTAFESYRHTNPCFRMWERSGSRRDKARTRVVACESRVERARLATVHHAGEWDRDLDRRDAAVADRKAFGAELANLARIYIAQIKQDPSITDVCSGGPRPDVELPPVPRSARGRDTGDTSVATAGDGAGDGAGDASGEAASA